MLKVYSFADVKTDEIVKQLAFNEEMENYDLLVAMEKTEKELKCKVVWSVKTYECIAVWGISNTASLNVWEISNDNESMLVGINDSIPQWFEIEWRIDEEIEDENDNGVSGIDFHGTFWRLDECMRTNR